MFTHSVKMKKTLAGQIQVATWLYSNLGERGVRWNYKNDGYCFKEEKDMTAFLLRWM